MNKMKIKIPGGYLVVEEKGTVDEYPGIYVNFSKDGETIEADDSIAMIEYDKDDGIQTVVDVKGKEEPIAIIVNKDGRNKIAS